MAELNKWQQECLDALSCYQTEAGRRHLDVLRKMTNDPIYKPGMPDPERAPFWLEGRRSLVLTIETMLSEAQRIHEETHQIKAAPVAVSILDENEESDG